MIMKTHVRKFKELAPSFQSRSWRMKGLLNSKIRTTESCFADKLLSSSSMVFRINCVISMDPVVPVTVSCQKVIDLALGAMVSFIWLDQLVIIGSGFSRA